MDMIVCVASSCRVEVPITNHLRDFAPDLKKYNAMHFCPVQEDRNQDDCTFFLANIIP